MPRKKKRGPAVGFRSKSGTGNSKRKAKRDIVNGDWAKNIAAANRKRRDGAAADCVVAGSSTIIK